MSLFPMFTIQQTAKSPELAVYTDVKMDYTAGLPVWEQGEPVFVSGLEAVKSWAYRALLTARYRYPIFSWSYGCEMENLIGQPYESDTKRSEAKRYIEDALLVSPYITAVRVLEVSFADSTLHITAEFDTVYGKEEVYV